MNDGLHDQAHADADELQATAQTMHTRSSIPLQSGSICPACGSKRSQEARREERTVIYRCLHCWRLFALTV
jgi:DNA-directed RNA polymerase subunit RPC12/RpoP